MSQTRRKVAMTLDIDPAKVAAYKAEHDRLWPEVRDALAAVGITNASIWTWGGRLFYYAEWQPTVADETFDAAMARYAAMPRVAEWEALMHSYQRQVPPVGGEEEEGGRPPSSDVWWRECTAVWSSDF